MATKKIVKTGKKLMDNQDTKNRGDSNSLINVRISFSLDQETANSLTDEAYSRHMSRSELLRLLIREGLELK